jgi:hypothetical protein
MKKSIDSGSHADLSLLNENENNIKRVYAVLLCNGLFLL